MAKKQKPKITDKPNATSIKRIPEITPDNMKGIWETNAPDFQKIVEMSKTLQGYNLKKIQFIQGIYPQNPNILLITDKVGITHRITDNPDGTLEICATNNPDSHTFVQLKNQIIKDKVEYFVEKFEICNKVQSDIFFQHVFHKILLSNLPTLDIKNKKLSNDKLPLFSKLISKLSKINQFIQTQH